MVFGQLQAYFGGFWPDLGLIGSFGCFLARFDPILAYFKVIFGLFQRFLGRFGPIADWAYFRGSRPDLTYQGLSRVIMGLSLRFWA